MVSDHSVRTMRRAVQSPVGQLLEGVAGLNGAYNEYFFFTGPKPSTSHALVHMQYGVSLYAIVIDLFVLIAISPVWTGRRVHDTSRGTSRLVELHISHLVAVRRVVFHVSLYSTPRGDPHLVEIKISTGIF